MDVQFFKNHMGFSFDFLLSDESIVHLCIYEIISENEIRFMTTDPFIKIGQFNYKMNIESNPEKKNEFKFEIDKIIQDPNNYIIVDPEEIETILL